MPRFAAPFLIRADFPALRFRAPAAFVRTRGLDVVLRVFFDVVLRVFFAGDDLRFFFRCRFGGSVEGGVVDGGSVDGGSVEGGSVDGASVDGVRVDGARVDGVRIDGEMVDDDLRPGRDGRLAAPS